MASKKLKKAILAGVAGFAGAKALKQMGEMKTYLAEEGGDKAKVNYITKKSKPVSFKGKVKKAVNVYKEKGLNTGRGPGIKKTDSLADKALSGEVFGLGIMDGAKAGKMIKARGGKLVNLKATKLY